MNEFIKGQIRNVIKMIEHTEKTIEFSAIQDDGVITKQERKEIKKLKELNQRYIKELRKQIDK